jgi:hypothetical protein
MLAIQSRYEGFTQASQSKWTMVPLTQGDYFYAAENRCVRPLRAPYWGMPVPGFLRK